MFKKQGISKCTIFFRINSFKLLTNARLKNLKLSTRFLKTTLHKLKEIHKRSGSKSNYITKANDNSTLSNTLCFYTAHLNF